MTVQRRNNGQNSEQLRDVGIGEAGALCRPGRAEEEEKVWSGGVSDPASALFGPLRAGSLTPTCLVSVVQQIAARICAQIVTGFVTRSAPRSWPAAPVNVVMITRARSVVP
jgi:hypothetical protein